MTSEQNWYVLKNWIAAYVLFDKIDRHSGNMILALMEEMEVTPT